jgi:hypothetical protein
VAVSYLDSHLRSLHPIAPRGRVSRRQRVQEPSTRHHQSLTSYGIVSAIKDGLTVATVDSLLAEPSATTKGHTLKRQWVRRHKLTPIQLLSALQTALVEEQPGLMLSYFSLHERCFQLLDTIRSELRDRFIKYVGNPFIADQTTQMPFLVLHIFTIAMKSGEAAEAKHVARDFRRE